MRKGETIYIDMTHVELFNSSQKCSFFEFSKVESISFGTPKDNKGISLIFAKVGNQVYIYEIAGIDQEGYLEKKLNIMDLNKVEGPK